MLRCQMHSMISKSGYLRKAQWCGSPWSCSCDVVCSRDQEAVVVPVLHSGQVVANACHHNADVTEGSTTDGVFHIPTDAHMDLEDSINVNDLHAQAVALGFIVALCLKSPTQSRMYVKVNADGS